MSDAATGPDANGVHRTRLFAGICLALIPTGASFALLANVMTQLRGEFLLSGFWVGQIAGAGVSGMAISLLILGPLLEGFGMKLGTFAAFAGHLVGLVLLLAAAPFAGTDLGFWLLLSGAFVMAMGHGMIEVAGNPLAAALFPEKKSTALNWFHAFFPIGILAGSLIGFGLAQLEGTAAHALYHWTFQLGIILIPIIIYGVMVLPQKFPKTENAEAGLPVADMFKNTLTSPLMYLLLFLMAIAISVELGAGRWIPAVFARLDIEGTLLLSWISVIMIVLRLNAEYFVDKFTPPGLLTMGGFSMALGLLLFGTAQGTAMAFLGATFFGIGVSFFFPTTVGIVAERLPQTGSLGIVLTCGIGLGAAGQIGTPGIGLIGDIQVASFLNEEERRDDVVLVLERARETFPGYRSQAEQAEDPLEQYGYLPADIGVATDAAGAALEAYREDQEIRGDATPGALQAITAAVPGAADRLFKAEHPEVADEDADLSEEQIKELRDAFDERIRELIESGDDGAIAEFANQSAVHTAVLAGALLGPAEGYGGQRSLLLIAWIPLILFVTYGVMFLYDRTRGGYKARTLHSFMGKGEEMEVPHEGAVPSEYADELTVSHGEGEGEKRE